MGQRERVYIFVAILTRLQGSHILGIVVRHAAVSLSQSSLDEIVRIFSRHGAMKSTPRSSFYQNLMIRGSHAVVGLGASTRIIDVPSRNFLDLSK